ncbi:hypothetical protein NC652_012187 [Populus alba x Populus x berolinensis]|nr:hypothetical protein NC652_012187 [Populus alba x Populus x berolinensis]
MGDADGIDWLWILQYPSDTEVDLLMENAFFTAEADEETEGFLLSFMLNLSSTSFS